MRSSEEELRFKLTLNDLHQQARAFGCDELLHSIDNIATIYWKIYKRGKDIGDRYHDHDYDHIG
jgi:hypothetical protein